VAQAGFAVANIAVINPVHRQLARVIDFRVRTIGAVTCSPAGPQLLTLLKDPSRGHGWLVPVSGRTGRASRRIALDGEPNGIVFAR